MDNPFYDPRLFDPRWQRVAFDAWLLTCEAALVVWLRLGKLAVGGSAAAAESQLMVDEKIKAAIDLQWRALTGGLGASPRVAASRSIAHYRKAVGKNRRRLVR